MGLDTFKLVSFENYYNQNVSKYFERVGAYGNDDELAEQLVFTQWLEYFADRILDELYRLQKQIAQRQSSLKTELEAHHHQILKLIDEKGFATDKDYAQVTDRAKATRILDFNRLIDLGIIVRAGSGRGTYYRRK